MRHWERLMLPLVVGLLIASACTSGGCDDCIASFRAVASGQNVVTHKNLADTAARATFTIDGWGMYLTFTYVLGVAPHGTVNGIRILQGTVTKGTICSAAPCATSGRVTGITDTALHRTMRNVEATVWVYSDSDPAGAAYGAITP